MELQVKTNNGSIKCFLNEPTLPDPSKCRSCGKEIYWVKTESGKNMPVEIVNDVEFVSHFSTCPQGNDWRKKKK